MQEKSSKFQRHNKVVIRNRNQATDTRNLRNQDEKQKAETEDSYNGERQTDEDGYT